MPLQIPFGPADGNPIGLGLLAMLAVPLGGGGAVAGMIKMQVRYLRNRQV